MTNEEIQVKMKQRVNKGDSDDYLNIQCWMISEAFNKAMDAWTIRQIQGLNQTKTTAEGSLRAIDKLQVILTEAPLTISTTTDLYTESYLPLDYLDWSRFSIEGEANCCPPRRIVVFVSSEADRDINLVNEDRTPDFDWATTFATILSDKVRIYSNSKFNVVNPAITYYRKPKHIRILGCTDLDTGLPVTVEQTCEFSDSVTELIIDEAAAILAADMDAYQKTQYLNAAGEQSN